MGIYLGHVTKVWLEEEEDIWDFVNFLGKFFVK